MQQRAQRHEGENRRRPPGSVSAPRTPHSQRPETRRPRAGPGRPRGNLPPQQRGGRRRDTARRPSESRAPNARCEQGAPPTRHPTPPPRAGREGVPLLPRPCRLDPHTHTSAGRPNGAAGSGKRRRRLGLGHLRDDLERSRGTTRGPGEAHEARRRDGSPRRGESRNARTRPRPGGECPLRQETPGPRRRREAGGGGERGRAGFRTPAFHTPPSGGWERRGARRQSEKSGPIRQECPSLVWRGLGPARESATSPHRSEHNGKKATGEGSAARTAIGGACFSPATHRPSRRAQSWRREPQRGGSACQRQNGAPRQTRTAPVCLHGEGGGTRGERTRNACHPPPATLGCQRPEGFVSTAVPPGTPGLRASRRAGPSGRLTQPETRAGHRAAGRAPPRGGGQPTRTRRGARPPSGTVRQRTACPHLSGGTKCRSLAKKLPRPSAGPIHGPQRPPRNESRATGPRSPPHPC